MGLCSFLSSCPTSTLCSSMLLYPSNSFCIRSLCKRPCSVLTPYVINGSTPCKECRGCHRHGERHVPCPGLSVFFCFRLGHGLRSGLSRYPGNFKIFGQGFSVIQSPRGIALLFLLLYLYPLFLLFLLYANKRLRMCVLCDILYV